MQERVAKFVTLWGARNPAQEPCEGFVPDPSRQIDGTRFSSTSGGRNGAGPQQCPAQTPCGISGRTEPALNLTRNSVVGALGTKMPPKEQVAFSFPVPGTGHTLDKSFNSIRIHSSHGGGCGRPPHWLSRPQKFAGSNAEQGIHCSNNTSCSPAISVS